MVIPAHLDYPDMTPAHKELVVAFVKENRKAMRKVPAFDTTDAAVEAAVQMAKKEKFSNPSVWKEPADIGTKYIVVHNDLREKAQNAGYIEEVNQQKIHDLTHGIKRAESDAKDMKCGEPSTKSHSQTAAYIPHDVDGWTSNGYGLILNGKPVAPLSEEDQ